MLEVRRGLRGPSWGTLVPGRAGWLGCWFLGRMLSGPQILGQRTRSLCIPGATTESSGELSPDGGGSISVCSVLPSAGRNQSSNYVRGALVVRGLFQPLGCSLSPEQPA